LPSVGNRIGDSCPAIPLVAQLIGDGIGDAGHVPLRPVYVQASLHEGFIFLQGCLESQYRRPWAVLIGASIALVCVSAIGVAVGGLLGEYPPLAWIKRAAAVAFIIIGVLILVGKF